MIVFLRGKLVGRSATMAFIDVNGVGYGVSMSGTSLSRLPESGAPVEVLTYLQVSESGMALYGFLSERERALFEELISVSGIGPKVAQAALGFFEPDDLIRAIAADDVAQESRAIRVDAAETGDPMMALAQQFADQDYEVLLYDEHSNQNRRGEYVASLVKNSGAQGLVLFMQQFCDPEEMEYPYLKKALDNAGVPHIKLGVDQQMRDFGQASTAIQAFADVL